jgi:FKBP-type peptidyl-prolyl cis-trans isomerase FklB
MSNAKKVLGCVAGVLFGVIAIVWIMGNAGTLASAQGAAAEKPAAPAAPAAPPPMKDVSYCIGLKIGQNMKQQEIALAPDDFMEGLKNGLSGAKPRMTDADMDKVLQAFQEDMTARLEGKMKRLAEENKKKGDDYLARNKTAAGVKTLASGLQYKVLREGTGKQPAAADTVTVNYRGTLIDGTEFDSTYTRKEPATLVVNEIIPGWTEALLLMKEGAKWQLVIPPSIGYGDRGAGRLIAPNSVLIFEVELVKVK